MKRYFGKVVIIGFMLAALLPLRARAAGKDGFLLDTDGTVTVVSEHAKKEAISSMSFSLSVDAANAASVDFQFQPTGVKIMESRYDETSGRLNVYLADADALFATDELKVGRVRALDAGGNEIAAKVSVVENSLQYVYGPKLETMQEPELPGTVQIGPASQPEQPDPGPLKTPEPLETPAPTAAPAATQAPTAAPAATQAPTAATQAPSAPQNPSSPQAPAAPQNPAASPAPVIVLPTPAAVAALPRATSRPTQAPQATQEPRSTQAPADSSESSESTPPSESGSSEAVPDIGEDTLTVPSPTPGADGQEAEDEAPKKEINWFIVMAVGVVLVVVIIEVMAFVVLKKPHGSRRGDRRGE